jgi:hypothetical protein
MIPSHIRISKAINLHTSKDSVFSLVSDISKWKQWHPAFMDSSHVQGFDSIRILNSKRDGDTLLMDLQQGNKEPVATGWKVYEHQSVDSITLQWYMDFHLKWYPWKKFSSLFFENTYGVMMEQGLSNIKKITTQ